MNRLISTTCLVAFVAAGTVAAQSTPPAAPPQTKPAGQTVTVTGCVAPGTGAGQYTLTNAMMGGSMADKGTATAEKGKAGDHAMSYNLMGGGDLKPHVGHKVEVTGTVERPKTSTDTAAAKDQTTPGTLNVTNVKMISATCP